MSNVIIGIHGLGNKPPGEVLEKWWKESIMEGLKKTGYRGPEPKFKLIYWADIPYLKPLDGTITDKDDPLYLEEKYTPSPPGFVPADHSLRKKVIDFVFN